jgi:hypothetical protein
MTPARSDEEHAMTIKVLDPRLDSEGDPMTMAPPLSSLEGATVGLLDNAKIGTGRFYDHLEGILRAQFGVREFIRRRKPDSSRPAPPELLAELSAADAIVSAVGD